MAKKESSIKIRPYSARKSYGMPKIRTTAKEKAKSSKKILERVPTGIPGFDNLIEGGFLKNSINLISGDPGTSKSIFCMQYLMNGIMEYGEPAVFVSFEEKKEVVYPEMLLFGWDLKKLEDEGKFIFLEYTPEQVDKVIRFGGGIVSDTIATINAKRLVIDSITAIISLYKSTIQQREVLLQLFNLIRKWECTALVISETPQQISKHTSDIEEYEVDGDILMYTEVVKMRREKYLEVFKMRGTKHSNMIHKISVDNKGITVK